MVFHAHMLNPRVFLEDTMRSAKKDLWDVGMPWQLVNQAIDTEFNYSPSDLERKQWASYTGLNWKNEDDVMVKDLRCPFCGTVSHVPWTTCGASDKKSESAKSGLVGSGYGDGDFSHHCACGKTITKEILSLDRFVRDVTLLVTSSVPMPATILDPRTGKPDAIGASTRREIYPRTFPNRMIRLDLYEHILDLFKSHEKPTMETVKDHVEKFLGSRTRIARANLSGHYGRSFRPSVRSYVCIRKMMARYWENFSIFGLDLCGAVMRQGVFIEKMVNLDWLHSPSARNTMERLRVKYGRFATIMGDYPTQVAVPTLDVDLAWHTHQLNPPAYYAYMVGKTDKFIDHDDKIEEGKLSDAFGWTSKVYQDRYHAVYSECTCWYCECKWPIPSRARLTRQLFARRTRRPSGSSSTRLPATKLPRNSTSLARRNSARRISQRTYPHTTPCAPRQATLTPYTYPTTGAPGKMPSYSTTTSRRRKELRRRAAVSLIATSITTTGATPTSVRPPSPPQRLLLLTYQCTRPSCTPCTLHQACTMAGTRAIPALVAAAGATARPARALGEPPAERVETQEAARQGYVLVLRAFEC